MFGSWHFMEVRDDGEGGTVVEVFHPDDCRLEISIDSFHTYVRRDCGIVSEQDNIGDECFGIDHSIYSTPNGWYVIRHWVEHLSNHDSVFAEITAGIEVEKLSDWAFKQENKETA